MNTDLDAINQLPGVLRVENCPKSELSSVATEMTHSVYPHDEVYGEFCTVMSYVNCPAEMAFDYLAQVKTLEEWTYSTRDFLPVSDDGLYEGIDRIGGTTKIFAKVVANREAMTVDYHCAWDQGEHLWMIYLMRVVPAPLVLNKPGCVITWTNCRHPFYDQNPRPEAAPSGRKVWVGDMWLYFYAGHKIELENLKRILEFRYANNILAESEVLS